jgi:hypothetical protein
MRQKILWSLVLVTSLAILAICGSYSQGVKAQLPGTPDTQGKAVQVITAPSAGIVPVRSEVDPIASQTPRPSPSASPSPSPNGSPSPSPGPSPFPSPSPGASPSPEPSPSPGPFLN